MVGTFFYAGDGCWSGVISCSTSCPGTALFTSAALQLVLAGSAGSCFGCLWCLAGPVVNFGFLPGRQHSLQGMFIMFQLNMTAPKPLWETVMSSPLLVINLC